MRMQLLNAPFLLLAIILLMVGCSIDPATVANDERAEVSSREEPTVVLEPSLPVDPFDLESSPIRATFLISPLHRDGIVLLDGEDVELHTSLTGQLYAAAIPGLCIPRTQRVIEAFACMRPLVANQKSYELTDLIRERNVDFFGATHVIEVAVSGGGQDAVSLDLAMSIPDGSVHQTTVTSGPGEDFFLVAEAVGWIVSNAGLDLSQEELARARLPLWGPDIGGWDDELRGRLSADPDAPEWDDMMRLDPLPPLLILMRGLAAIGTGDRLVVQRHLPEPASENAHPYVHVTRSTMAAWLGDVDTARHERLLAAAKFPGLHGFILDWAWLLHDREEQDEDFAETMRSWYQRSAKSPYEAYLLGQALLDSAWKFRGTDFISNIPAADRELYTKYNSEAIDILEEAATRSGPTPWLSHARINAWGSFGEISRVRRIFEEGWSDFPDNPDLLRVTLNYMRPRWGGRHDMALKVIERILEERPENPYVFDQWLDYVSLESAFMRQERHWPVTEIEEWIEARPAWRDALEVAAERRLLDADDVDAAGDAFVAYSILKDDEAISSIVDRHPTLYREYVWNSEYAASSLARFAFEFAARDEWRKVMDVVDTIRRETEQGRETGLRNEFLLMMDLYAQLHMGEHDGLERRIDTLEQSGGYWQSAALYARLVMREDPDKVLSRMQGAEENSISMPVRAIAHARKGMSADESEEIRDTLASVDDEDTMIPRFMVNELKRILGGQVE